MVGLPVKVVVIPTSPSRFSNMRATVLTGKWAGTMYTGLDRNKLKGEAEDTQGCLHSVDKDVSLVYSDSASAFLEPSEESFASSAQISVVSIMRSSGTLPCGGLYIPDIVTGSSSSR